MQSEPTTRDAIDSWIREHQERVDPFADVARATVDHREAHGCDAYAGGDGPLLGALARAIRPARVLEIGTALGYGTLWLAFGSGDTARIETIEHDPIHAELARGQLASHGHAGHVEVLEGDDLALLPQLDEGTFDLIVYDAAVPTPRHLELFDRLLSGAGLLVSSNLFLGQHVPDLPGLEQGAEYREALFGPSWFTAFAREKALTFRSAALR